jgi:poly[(R)-3-hydroxyalkanoate] polymerase subunit PhaC
MSKAAPELPTFDLQQASQSIARIAERSQQLVAGFLSRRQDVSGIGMADPANIGKSFLNLTQQMMANPLSVAETTLDLWTEHLRLLHSTTERLFGAPKSVDAERRDRRFRDPAWSDNAIFEYVKQSYLLSSDAILSSVRKIEGLSPSDAHKTEFYTRQFVDAIAPSNFVATNPEVLKATLETGGNNLLSGLANLLGDLQRGEGRLAITMTSSDAFRIGENVATTPGKVIYQNELMQLIQYTPSTSEVRQRPLLIVPPWINKFYILDLRPENSFTRWAVAQGHTVFVISWANPDARLAEKTFEHYMDEGILAALDAIEQATHERTVNTIGYCLGGTLLASTLAYLVMKDEERIASATYFVSLVDFTDVGDMAVFIDEEQLAALECRMQQRGFLDAHDMATSFNMLRANDLIWSFVVNNYLLGKEPVPFDLLYWNADATRMPAAMHSFYLRNMYHENRLSQPGGIALKGVPIDLRLIETPSFLLSTREDHIAPWRSTYAATQIYGGPITFVLAASGHIAGVISPPGSKYGHWRNPELPPKADDWLQGAQACAGSWWPFWDKWVEQFAGGMVDARTPGDGDLSAIEDAPGSYVRVRAVS